MFKAVDICTVPLGYVGGFFGKHIYFCALDFLVSLFFFLSSFLANSPSIEHSSSNSQFLAVDFLIYQPSCKTFWQWMIPIRCLLTAQHRPSWRACKGKSVLITYPHNYLYAKQALMLDIWSKIKFWAAHPDTEGIKTRWMFKYSQKTRAENAVSDSLSNKPFITSQYL